MSEALAGLLEILDLEPIEVNIFRGRSPDEERQRVFGGQVAGQALVAAGRTVEAESDKVALQGMGPTSIHRRKWVFMDHLPWTALHRPVPEGDPTLF